VPLIAVASVKGSPWVTTTALALAAAWPARRRLLIEADPSGGDLGPWLGLPGHGLAALAAAGTRAGPGAAWDHAGEAAGGLHVLAAPPGAEHAAACLAALEQAQVLDEFAAGPGVAVADCGRLDPESPARWVAALAGALLILTRPRATDLAHLDGALGWLAQTSGRIALLITPRPAGTPSWPAYPAAEISAELGLPVLGSIPSDPQAVAGLISDPGNGGQARSRPLLRTAASLAGTLTGILTDSTAAVPSLAPRPDRARPAARRGVTARDARR
jgi:Mrp family chromosome partitioning ATPase